jgi:hypothetical protein
MNSTEKQSLVSTGRNDEPRGMVFVSLLVAPVVMLVAVWTERRRGASAGGWVAALPVSIPVAVLAVGLDSGPRVAEGLSWSAGAHVAAQVLFGLVFAAALRRVSVACALVCGMTAYGACSLIVACVPVAVAAAAAVPALLIGPRLVHAHASPASAPRRWTTTAVTCLGASAVVAAAILGSRYLGPGVGGALTAFPTVSSLLALSVATHDTEAGAHVLAGLIRSLPCYLTFCVIAAIALPSLGAAAAPLGLLVCLGIGRATWRALPAVTRSLSAA